MGETIQAFVEKIRTEGVQAGQQQADSLLTQAKQQAEEILRQAREQKDKIVAEGTAEAENILSRSRAELELATRDATLRLRDAIGRALGEVLAQGAKASLTDPEFVGKLLHEIISQYAGMDLEGKQAFRINVPDEMRQKLTDWALAEIGQDKIDGMHVTIDLKGTLSQAGFEYNATGATVEVTLDSVVAVLSELVGPKLREVLDRAMAEDKG